MSYVDSIQISRGGVPKQPVFEALITEQGLDGDRQADPRFHGGPDRAVILFSADVIRALRDEGHPIAAGTTGENLTLADLDWSAVAPGIELEIGDVRLAVTKFASPCEKIRGSFADGFFARISQRLHPGWSRVAARVIRVGVVRMNDPVRIV